MSKPAPVPAPVPPAFKPYNPQGTRAVHRRSSIQDAPSLIGGKLYNAGHTSPTKEKL